MKNIKIDKSIKIILSILVVYLIIMLIIFLPGYLKNRKEKLYLLTNFVKVKYENGKWSNIDDIENYNLKKFDVYEDSQYIGNYKIIYSNKFNIFDDDGKLIDYTGSIFASSGTLDLDVYDVSESIADQNDKEIVNKALSELNIISSNEYSFFQKISLDVDNDSMEETIYSVSNYYVDVNENTRYSIVFMYKNNKVIILDKYITDDEGIEDGPIFSILKLLDIKKDKKIELFYTKNYAYRPLDECGVLYSLAGKVKTIKDFCKE